MEPGRNELVEQGFEGDNHPVKARTDQDPDAPDHRHIMCHCQHADAVIIREQGEPLLDGKRHDSHVDVRDRGEVGWHLSYMLDEARIGDLDYANITALTRGCKL